MQGTPSSQLTTSQAEYQRLNDCTPDSVKGSDSADFHVGESRLSGGMTDEERELAIKRAGVAMRTWYSRYEQSQNPICLDLAHHFLTVQKTLLAGRSAEYVAKLEAERGLR